VELHESVVTRNWDLLLYLHEMDRDRHVIEFTTSLLDLAKIAWRLSTVDLFTFALYDTLAPSSNLPNTIVFSQSSSDRIIRVSSTPSATLVIIPC
jgi:hypothetical protein